MTFRTRGIIVLLAAAGLLLGVGVAPVDATPLPVGGSLLLVSGELDPTGGAVVPPTGVTVPFASGGFSGTLTSTVISGDPSNALGGLTFTYLLTNDAVSSNAISRVTVDSFTSFMTDVSYQTPAPIGSIPPSLVDRSTADVVGFSFLPTVVPGAGGVLSPGASSALMVVQTDAPTFTNALAFVIDGDTVNVASYAPLPEPGSFCLAALGVICLSAYAWRRRPMA
jgi:hypothetical protein